MQHLDEGTIHAWLDGALPESDARAVEAHLAVCSACASEVAEARGLIAASSRILSALDAVPGRVLPVPSIGSTISPDTRRRGTRALRGRRLVLRSAQVAAALAVVTAGGLVLAKRTSYQAVARSEGVPEARSKSAAPPASAPPIAPSTSKSQSTREATGRAPAMPLVAAVAPRDSSDQAAAPKPAAPSPRSPAAVVRGRVVNESGAPVTSASVSLAEAPSVRTHTGADGSYKLVVPAEHLADRQATLTVQQLGYRPRSDVIPLVSTRPITRDFVLASNTLGFSEGAAGGARPGAGAGAAPRAAVPQRALPPVWPRLVRSDTMPARTGVVERRLYEVRPGVRVILTIARGAAAARYVPTPALDSTPVPESIRWTTPDGTAYTLTGALSPAELLRIRDELRSRLP